MKLLNHFLRKYASLLAGYHKPAPAPPLPTEPVAITCISDTHDTEPPLPLGDILIAPRWRFQALGAPFPRFKLN